MMSYSTSVFIFLITFLSHYSAVATATTSSDNSTLNTILSAVTPTPSGWSSTTHFCYWRGVECDTKNSVIVLDISSQSLSGPLPSFANLSRLRKLYLHNNSFTSIPTGAFSGLTSLQILSLSNNTNLSPWPFPSELLSSPKMAALEASNANIVGSIPDIFCSFPSLRSLTLSYNNLSGSLPGSFNGSSIQELKLDNQNPGLTGSIDLLSGMNHLSVVWIHGNKFTGAVPASLVSMPNLSDVRIDESNNDFMGSDSFRRSNVGVGSFNCVGCKVHIRADVDNGTVIPVPSPAPAKSSSSNKTIIVVGTIVVLVVIILIVVACIYFKKRNEREEEREHIRYLRRLELMDVQGPQVGTRKNEERRKEKEQVETTTSQVDEGAGTSNEKKPQHSKKAEKLFKKLRYRMERNEVVAPKVGCKPGELLASYNYGLLEQLTNKFDAGNIIGKGGFGEVYRGTFPDRTTMVAIKLLRFEGKIDDYENEVEALGRTNHPNLMRLLGYCKNEKHQILVYEYISNGSLDKWMFNTDPNRSLTWPQIKNIIQGIAQGLVHLHMNKDFGGKDKILHRDLKPANVLLDAKMNAKLCDFGLAKLLDMDQTSTWTKCLCSFGYGAPEVLAGRINEKVDVYSFGIVVLELLFHTRYVDLLLPDRITVAVSQLPDLITQFSPTICGDGKEIKKLGELAVSCIQSQPEKRPTMPDILADIQSVYAKFGKSTARRNRPSSSSISQ